MLALCIHLMRGTPYVYQGEELGMTNAYFEDIGQYKDVESLNYYRILQEQGLTEADIMARLMARSRDNSRTPMQWNAEKNAGFTSGTPWIAVPTRKSEANAEAEEKDTQSILSFYKRLIHLRKEKNVIAEGDIRFICDVPGIIAYERTLGNEKTAVYCNFTGESIAVPANGQRCLMDSYEDVPMMKDGSLTLRPYEGIAMAD